MHPDIKQMTDKGRLWTLFKLERPIPSFVPTREDLYLLIRAERGSLIVEVGMYLGAGDWRVRSPRNSWATLHSSYRVVGYSIKEPFPDPPRELPLGIL